MNMSLNQLFSACAALLVAFVLVAVPVAADGTVVCKENGQRYDAATYTRDGAFWTLEYQRPAFRTTAVGDETGVAWTANKNVRAVYGVTDGVAVLLAENVRSGEAVGELDSLVLCLRGSSGSRAASASIAVNDGGSGLSGEQVPEDAPEEVPEFGTVALVAVGLLGVGLVAAKRH